MTRVESSFSLIPVVTLDMLHFRYGTSPNSFPQTAEFAFVASPPWPSSQFWSISPARRLFEIFSFSHQNSFWPDVIIFWFKKNKAEFVRRTRWPRWTIPPIMHCDSPFLASDSKRRAAATVLDRCFVSQSIACVWQSGFVFRLGVRAGQVASRECSLTFPDNPSH